MNHEKNQKLLFLLAENFVLAYCCCFGASDFLKMKKPQKRVAVIVEKSGDEKMETPFIEWSKAGSWNRKYTFDYFAIQMKLKMQMRRRT